MIILKNGKILDENGNLKTTDILIENGKISKIAKNITEENAKVFELNEKSIFPGFIDMHVHLREPGFERKETIKTGTEAAVRGGFTTIAPMPNTKPVLDSIETLNMFEEIVKKDAVSRVIPFVSITLGEKGVDIVNMNEFSDRNILGFSDDGKGVQNAGVMFKAMEKAKNIDKPIVAHCEDESLLFGGYIHAGKYCEENNHRGILSASESAQVARDIILAKETGVHYHICHISTKESVELVRFAKSMGINVTAEVTPHHLILSDNDINADDGNFKMNPPLRSEEDRQACVKGILDGTIDIIATDHAPHTQEEKQRGLKNSPFGIVGFETAFSLLYTHFVKTNIFDLSHLINIMATKPAEIFNLPYGKLKEGCVADITVIDLEKSFKIDPNTFKSKGKNTPFTNYEVYGETYMTLVDGNVVYLNN